MILKSLHRRGSRDQHRQARWHPGTLGNAPAVPAFKSSRPTATIPNSPTSWLAVRSFRPPSFYAMTHPMKSSRKKPSGPSSWSSVRHHSTGPSNCATRRPGARRSAFHRFPTSPATVHLPGLCLGVLKLNRSTVDADASSPFGGWKASGIGPAEHVPPIVNSSRVSKQFTGMGDRYVTRIAENRPARPKPTPGVGDVSESILPTSKAQSPRALC